LNFLCIKRRSISEPDDRGIIVKEVLYIFSLWTPTSDLDMSITKDSESVVWDIVLASAFFKQSQLKLHSFFFGGS